MSRWKVTWTREACNYYSRMPAVQQEKFGEVVRKLGADPLAVKDAKRLHGKLEGFCRYRSGKLRMIYRLDEKAKEVRILAIASRGDVYKR